MLPLVGIVGRAGSGKSTVARILQEEFGVVPLALADPLKLLCLKAFPEISERQLFGPSEAREEFVEGLQRRCSDIQPGTVQILTDFAVSRFGVEENRARIRACLLLEGLHFKMIGGTVASARLVAQHVGTEFGRALREDGWTAAMLATAGEILRGGVDYSPSTGIVPQASPKPCMGVAVQDVRFPQEAIAILQAGGFLVRVRRDSSDVVPATHVSETAINTLGDWAFSDTFINNGSPGNLRATIAVWWRSWIGEPCPWMARNYSPIAPNLKEVPK